MTAGIRALVVADGSDIVARVESALATVYDEVDTVATVDGDATPDCVIAVAPLTTEDWATVETATTQGTRPPLVVLVPDAGFEPATDDVAVEPTDVVVDDGEERYTALANRVRGMVQLRRSEGHDDLSAATDGHLTALHEIATDGDLSFEEKAERMLAIGIERLDVENAHISTIEREPERYEIVASVGDLPISPGDLRELPSTFCRRTIETDEVLSFSHASEQGWADDPAYEQSGVECYLGSRIVVGGSLHGTVCFLDRSPHDSFTAAERTFVSLVARWLSHELERTRRRDALDRLHAGTADLMRATTKAEVCDAAVAIAGDVVESPVAHAWIVDEAGETLEPVATRGAGTSPDPVSREADHGARLWAALDEGSVGQYDDGDRGVVDGSSVDTVRSEVVVPLGEYGVVAVASDTADAFDAIDASLLKMLGSNAAAALERTERIEELTAAHERARRIFESASDGLLLVDPDADEIIDCNDRAAAVLGYEDPDALQAVAPSDICRDDPRNYWTVVDAVEESGRGRVEGLTCRRQDGKRIPTEVTATTVDLPAGSAVLASLRDISDRQRREQALDVFNRVLRHNIRNDMNVILGHAGMIHDDCPDPDVRANVTEIRRTGRELIDLGEKARTFQKIDDRDTDADRVDLRTILDEVASTLESEYPTATIAIEGAETATAAVDSTVDIAFRELIENAIKHATTDRPAVSVGLSRVDDERQFAVTISDDGPGLPPQDCTVLEGDTETPLNHGSGLGLWLANWVVENTGGSVSVLGADETGTTIRVALPAETGIQAESPPHERS